MPNRSTWLLYMQLHIGAPMWNIAVHLVRDVSLSIITVARVPYSVEMHIV
jgi:hypothetical protein